MELYNKNHTGAFFKKQLLTSIILLILIFYSGMLPATPSDSTTSDTILKSPRATFKIFRSAMRKARLSDYSKIWIAIDCISTRRYKKYKGAVLNTVLLNKALKLYNVLRALDYSLTEIPDPKPTTNELDITLGADDKFLTFKMIKNNLGNWQFSDSNFSNTKFQELYHKKVQETKMFSTEALGGDTYDKSMISPAQSYSTFMNGIENKYGFTMENAIQVLDMSKIHPLLRPVLGKYYAIMIYRIIKNENIRSLSSLSDQPNYPFPEIFSISSHGHIAMDTVTLPGEQHLKAWKFTQETVNNIQITYDEYMDNSTNVKPLKLKDIPLLFMVSDWAHQYHFLTIKYFEIELWVWLEIIFVFLFIPPIVFIAFSLIYRYLFIHIIYKFVRKVYHKELGISFVLPLQFLILFLIYHYLLINIVLSEEALYIGYYIIDILLILLSIWLSWILLNFLCELILKYFEKHKTIKRNKTEITVFIVCRLLQIILTICAFFELIRVLGFDSLQVLTTMGLGALAIALAGKDTIENLLGTLLITLEKPFKIGDWILIDKVEGIVEHVGLRSTRIRTFYDSYLTIPNAMFITIPVDNMEERPSRRFKTNLNIEYTTTAEEAKAFTEGIEELIRQTPYTRKDYFHIRMHNFHEESIEIMIYMFFITPDWATELRERERFILNIMKLAEELKIEFAYVKNNRLLLDLEKDYKEHEKLDMNKAPSLGKKSAKNIVSRLMGSPAKKPPPVKFKE